MRALLLAAVLTAVGCGTSTIVSPCPGQYCSCSSAMCTCKQGATCIWDAGGGGALSCTDVATCSGSCGESCNGVCSAQSVCQWNTGPNSVMNCNDAWCILTVGAGASITCTNAKCDVVCATGSCSLTCTTSTCSLACPGDADGGRNVSDAGGGACL